MISLLPCQLCYKIAHMQTLLRSLFNSDSKLQMYPFFAEYIVPWEVQLQWNLKAKNCKSMILKAQIHKIVRA